MHILLAFRLVPEGKMDMKCELRKRGMKVMSQKLRENTNEKHKIPLRRHLKGRPVVSITAHCDLLW